VLKYSTLLHETLDQTKVKTFLESVGRNSPKSREVYGNGLFHLHNFLKGDFKEGNVTLENIVEHVESNEINIYNLLDNFVNYLVTEKKLSPNSVLLYVTAIRSYFAYYDVDVVPAKFKRKVRLPRHIREDEVPLDAADIRKILLSCNNRRLKAYLLVLASGGMRATEALSLRIKDLDRSTIPTKIHIRKEFAKTRVGRDVYISAEATSFLNEWLNFKYRKRGHGNETPIKSPDDLVFLRQSYRQSDLPLDGLYNKLVAEFNKILQIIGMDERKEGMLRRKITLHSLRRHAKTVISDQTNQDYSEWFLGHAGSPYYTKKEADRRELYATRCMKYLTFLDYTTLESTGKNIELKLEEKDRELMYLRVRDSIKEETLNSMADQLLKLTKEVESLKLKG
jgi:integrase